MLSSRRSRRREQPFEDAVEAECWRRRLARVASPHAAVRGVGLDAARMELAASGGAREEVADRQRVERLRRPELAEVGQVEQQRDGEIDRPVPTGCVHGIDAVFGAPDEARGLQVLNTAEHG